MLKNCGVGIVLASGLQLGEGVLTARRAVEALCVPQVHEVVPRLIGKDLLVAEGCLGKVLLRSVDVGELLPGFQIILHLLNVLVEYGNCLGLHVHVAEEADQPLDGLRIVWVLLKQVK